MRHDRLFVVLWMFVLVLCVGLATLGHGEGDISLFAGVLATSLVVAVGLRRRAVGPAVARACLVGVAVAFVAAFVAVHATGDRSISVVQLAANLALELLLLATLLYFEYRYWRGFDGVEMLLSANVDGYATVVRRREAAPQMEAELARSARNGDPLTVVVFERDDTRDQPGINHFVDALDRTGPGLLEHLASVFARTQMTALMSESARRSDLVMTESDSRVVVVSSATPKSGAEVFALRMQRAAEMKLGIPLVAGVAAWPADGSNVDELVALASRRARGGADIAVALEPVAVEPVAIEPVDDVTSIDAARFPLPAPLSGIEP